MKALSFYCGEDTEMSMDAIKAEIAMEIRWVFVFVVVAVVVVLEASYISLLLDFQIQGLKTIFSQLIMWSSKYV